MRLQSSEKIATNTYKLEIKIDPEEFSKALDFAFKRDSKRISVPGFRKGKAPRAFIEKYYGESVFFDTAIKKLYPEAINSAFDEFDQKIVGSEGDKITEIGKDVGITITTTVYTYPEVKIGNYKGLELEEIDTNVTDADIDSEIENRLSRSARLVSEEGAVSQDKDMVLVDFEGFVDGKSFDGGSAKNFSIKIGQGNMIPGFEEQLCGHKVDEDFEIKVTFPENYSEESLASKEAVFKCALRDIKRPVLPEFNDEFVQDTSEFDTVKDYKEDIKKSLEQKKINEKSSRLERIICDKLRDMTEAEIPQVLITEAANKHMASMEANITKAGIKNLKQYAEMLNISMDQIASECNKIAESKVKLSLALDKIAELENIELTEEDAKAFIKRSTEKVSDEQLDKMIKNILTEPQLMAVKDEIKREKAYKIVEESVKFVKQEKEKKPKKESKTESKNESKSKSTSKSGAKTETKKQSKPAKPSKPTKTSKDKGGKD